MSAQFNNKTNAQRLQVWTIPALVFLASFGLTIFATFYAARSARLETKQRFQAAVMQAEGAVRTRMESYLALLRGGTAFYAGNPNVSRLEFHQYVKRLRLPLYYPGVQGFGFTVKLSPDETNRVVEIARKEGVMDFKLWPEVSPGEELHAILYLEPLDLRNRAALGYNMHQEPVRRAAMERARDTGVAVVSGRVKLVQEIDDKVQAGFLIYAPVYKEGNVPSTLEQRRELLVGFVYSPFRADDLFANVFTHEALSLLDLSIYDGAGVDPKKLLHRSTNKDNVRRGTDFLRGRMEVVRKLTVAEHEWTLHCRWKPGPTGNWLLVPIVLVGGILVSVMLSLLALSEGRARRRAEVINEQLSLSEQSLREARGRLEEHASELEERVAERTAMLRESVRDLEAVLYHVAHDLRAPVRAMGSFASILREDYIQHLDARAIGYLERITQAAGRMDHLVYDLLAYGRLAQMPLPLESASLEEAVRLVVGRVSNELKRLGAKVEVVGPMPRVQANPPVLTDVLSRLLDNAIKFVPAERAPRIRIWASTGDAVRLHMEDNGIGIRPEYHERIFRVFEKLHSGSVYPGTGIGLAVVRKATERMGGKVGVESMPEQGSTFWIELQAETRSENRSQKPPHVAPESEQR